MTLRDLFNKDMTPNWTVFEKTFPEMETLKHSMRWHDEGSPLEHTKLVTNWMQKFLKETWEYHNSEYYDDNYLIMMSAAMLHDIGKPSTTYWNEKERDWCCKSHGEAGERIFRNLFREERIDLREKVAYMIHYHMTLHNFDNKPIDKQKEIISRLADGTMPFETMLLLNECDLRGSSNKETTEESISNHISLVKSLYEDTEKNSRWNYIDKDTIPVFVMIGVAGSGKSTYAHKLQAEYKTKTDVEIPIVSRDLIRVELGYCKEGEKYLGTEQEENEVTKIVDKRIKELCNERKVFIIDNTSLKKKARKQYLDLCKEYNAVPIYIYVEAPSMEENIKRREGQIDATIIERMWNTMEFPTKDECCSLRLVNPKNERVITI